MAFVNQNYQTIDEFMKNPFYQNNFPKYTTYMSRYNKYKLSHLIEFSSYAIIEDAYYIHLKVQSETNKDKIFYDVVIRFFTNSDKIKNEPSLRNYYLQFFSNSPGFMYNYAIIYRVHGYLIDFLYEKLDPNYTNILPSKTNVTLDLSYDSSIFYACAFLSDNRFSYLQKSSLKGMKKKEPNDFFDDIKNFEDMKFNQEVVALEKEYQKAQASKDILGKQKADRDRHSLIKDRTKREILDDRKIKSKKTTDKTGLHYTVKEGKKSTGRKSSIIKIGKRSGRKSTIKP